MNKFGRRSCIWFLTGSTLLPILLLAGEILGYVFSDACYYMLSAACAGMIVLSCIILVKSKTPRLGVGFGLLISLCALSNTIGAMLFIFGEANLPYLILMLIGFVISLFLLIRFVRSLLIRVVALVLCAVLIFPTFAFAPFMILLKDFGKVTVVKTILSPDQKHEAQLIDIDQGALGGATEIQVVKHRKNRNCLFYDEKPPMELYSTGWGAADNLNIEWKDENTLLINGAEYPIR